ncbi:hypothetical protein [Tissierella carlieri]|uniref:hypothetical protein n=1 Tax=Tissierella carlieri TaxID=689904 RepID=UPI001FE6D902|nr:hypothetical protein [Tissierella carlieri]
MNSATNGDEVNALRILGMQLPSYTMCLSTKNKIDVSPLECGVMSTISPVGDFHTA